MHTFSTTEINRRNLLRTHNSYINLDEIFLFCIIYSIWIVYLCAIQIIANNINSHPEQSSLNYNQFIFVLFLTDLSIDNMLEWASFLLSFKKWELRHVFHNVNMITSSKSVSVMKELSFVVVFIHFFIRN